MPLVNGVEGILFSEALPTRAVVFAKACELGLGGFCKRGRGRNRLKKVNSGFART
jgi:hypothetical protein